MIIKYESSGGVEWTRKETRARKSDLLHANPNIFFAKN